MSEERFEILNEKDEALVGLIETDHPRKRQPAAIFLNGFLDTMDSTRKRQLAALLRKDGLVTVRFDYTYGFGQGTGNVAMFTITSQVKDAERVIDYAMRRGYVDPDQVVLIGHCYGGMAAILLAAFDSRVKGLVTLSAPYHFQETKLTRMDEHELSRVRLKRYFHIYSDNLKKEVRVDYSFFEDGMKKDMARATRNLHQPILVIHGSEDESIPLSNAREIYERVAGKKELIVIPEMGHHPSEKDIKLIYPPVRAFLKRHLKL
jgi:pimeloyl-ACP methyl ester carboxylesterase